MMSGVRRRLRPTTVLWIAVMWCLLYGEFSWANVLGGLAIGLLIVMLFPLPALPISGMKIRWLSLAALLFHFFVDLVESSWRVSVLALRPAEQPPSAIVRVPMRVQEDFIFAFAVGLLNLTPGGAVIELDIADRMLTMHILDARSTRELDRTLSGVAALERRLIRTFESEV